MSQQQRWPCSLGPCRASALQDLKKPSPRLALEKKHGAPATPLAYLPPLELFLQHCLRLQGMGEEVAEKNAKIHSWKSGAWVPKSLGLRASGPQAGHCSVPAHFLFSQIGRPSLAVLFFKDPRINSESSWAPKGLALSLFSIHCRQVPDTCISKACHPHF